MENYFQIVIIEFFRTIYFSSIVSFSKWQDVKQGENTGKDTERSKEILYMNLQEHILNHEMNRFPKKKQVRFLKDSIDGVKANSRLCQQDEVLS